MLLFYLIVGKRKFRVWYDIRFYHKQKQNVPPFYHSYFFLTLSPDEGNWQFSAGNQKSRVYHIKWFIVCCHDFIVSDQLQEREKQKIK